MLPRELRIYWLGKQVLLADEVNRDITPVYRPGRSPAESVAQTLEERDAVIAKPEDPLALVQPGMATYRGRRRRVTESKAVDGQLYAPLAIAYLRAFATWHGWREEYGRRLHDGALTREAHAKLVRKMPTVTLEEFAKRI